MVATQWSRRIKRNGLATFATCCSSWVWVSRSSSGRKVLTLPAGDENVDWVMQANCMLSRCTLFSRTNRNDTCSGFAILLIWFAVVPYWLFSYTSQPASQPGSQPASQPHSLPSNPYDVWPTKKIIRFLARPNPYDFWPSQPASQPVLAFVNMFAVDLFMGLLQLMLSAMAVAWWLEQPGNSCMKDHPKSCQLRRCLKVCRRHTWMAMFGKLVPKPMHIMCPMRNRSILGPMIKKITPQETFKKLLDKKSRLWNSKFLSEIPWPSDLDFLSRQLKWLSWGSGFLKLRVWIS